MSVKDVANAPIIPIAPEPVKDVAKGGVGVKKGKTEAKKKVSSTAKVDLPDAAMEVKVLEMPTVVPVEAKVEVPSVAKEVHVPTVAKVEVPTVAKKVPTVAKEVQVPSVGKVEEVRVAKEVHMPSVAKDKEVVSVAKAEVPSVVKVEVKVPETPPVVASISSLKSAEAPIQPTCVDEDEVVIVKETISKKFGEITFSDYDSAEDGDFSLSEADTEDSLEWASETERTRAEDDLAEDKVVATLPKFGALTYDC